MLRVPDVLDAEIDANLDKWIPGISDEYEREIRLLTTEERAERNDPDVRARIKHNLRAATPANVLLEGRKVMTALGSKGLATGIIRNPKKSFIIGSNPCVKTSGWKNLFCWNAEIWLPVACDVFVTPYLSYGTEKLFEIKEDRKIRGFNEAIFKQSSLIAGHPRKLIASLAGVKQGP